MEHVKWYVIERYISRNTGWVEEGPEFNSKAEAEAEAAELSRIYPDRYRATERTGTVIYTAK